MEPLHPRKTPHDVFVAKKIIQEGQSLCVFKCRSQKSSQLRDLPKHGFQMVPNTPSNPWSAISDCSQETYDERDQSLCVPSIVVPNVPNDKPNTKRFKSGPLFHVHEWQCFFWGEILHFFFNDVNNMISTHTKDYCFKNLALILPDFREFSLSPYFYDRFHHIAKYKRDS
jgi:hypothetical protein